MAIKVVVPISGGKDSQVCLKLALREYDRSEVLGLFCDTKFEHPVTYEHVKKISELYGVRIETVNAGDVYTEVMKAGRFPSAMARFCTYNLKMQPSQLFYKKLAIKQRVGFQVWLGVRSDESKERAERYKYILSEELYDPHEVLAKYPKYLYKKYKIMFRLPILDFSTQEVFDVLGDEGNSLYTKGFSRVGCFPCLAAGDATKEAAFTYDDFGRDQRKLVAELELATGKTVMRSKGGLKRDGDNFEGCALCAI